jgi:hypothetical protein
MKRFPDASTARPYGVCRDAFWATVWMTPLEITRTWFPTDSVMYRLPAPSNAMPYGLFSVAAEGGPPSPLTPGVPGPATVWMTPSVVTSRMQLLAESAMKTLPLLSTATPWGAFNSAAVAAPPSPE